MFPLQQPKQSAVRRVLSRREAAEHLNVSERTLERWALEGGGPPFCRLGARRVGYMIDALDAWLQARSYDSTSDETVKRGDAA